MNHSRKDNLPIDCGDEGQAEQGGGNADARLPEQEASPDASNGKPMEASRKRNPPSFTTPPRPGRRRLESPVYLRLRTILDYTDQPRILIPVELKDELEDLGNIDRGEHGRFTHRRAPPSILQSSEQKPSGEDTREQDAQGSDTPEGKPAQPTRRGALTTSIMSPPGFCKQVAELPKKGRLAVYSREAIKKLEKGGAATDSDVTKRNEKLFAQLEPKGALRRMGLARSIDDVLALEQSHPHFSEVIQFVADRISLQKASRRPVRIPPMMLFGPPGVGKTHFCEALASVLHVPVRRHPMDQAETSSALLGSEITWSNTRYGLVFELLAMGDYANPVVILDELDKASRGQGSSGSMASPTAVLHSLLEPVSAVGVRDLSVDIELDASFITWIATANYPWLIAPTLRSRMKEFLITMPTAEQAMLVAISVVAQAMKDSGSAWRTPPDRRFIAAVAHLSAREIYQATASAAASAVRRGGRSVDVMDLPRDVLLADEALATPLTLLH